MRFDSGVPWDNDAKGFKQPKNRGSNMTEKNTDTIPSRK